MLWDGGRFEKHCGRLLSKQSKAAAINQMCDVFVKKPHEKEGE